MTTRCYYITIVMLKQQKEVSKIIYTNRIIGLMKESGHTQKQLADYLHLSEYGLRRKLKGQSEFKASEILKISELYKVSIEYFFSDDIAKIAINDKEA